MIAEFNQLVHLVGSVPLENSTAVFTETCKSLGPYLSAVPDGETGERARWIHFQRTMLENHPDMEIDDGAEPVQLHSWDGKLLNEETLFRFKPGVDPDTVEFDTGYDRAAEFSYKEFIKLRKQGIVPDGLRFQVCLPTPVATSYIYVSPKAREEYHRVYERSLLRAAENIFESIPARDLAIQFDVCMEVLIFENYFQERPENYKSEVFSILGNLGNSVPVDIQMGYHLCYGSPQNQHLVMPEDTAVLVELMNGITSAVQRKIDFFHIPVPRSRLDDDYFLPLTDLSLDNDTKLYLGLVHLNDDDGNWNRFKVACKFADNFGIATECGLGQYDTKQVPDLLRNHRKLAEKIEYSIRSS